MRLDTSDALRTWPISKTKRVSKHASRCACAQLLLPSPLSAHFGSKEDSGGFAQSSQNGPTDVAVIWSGLSAIVAMPSL